MAELSPLYYVNVGPKGTFRKSGKRESTPDSVDDIFKELKKTSAKKLVLYFHGGLVREADGWQCAEELTPIFQEAGAHPVTFIWETGFLETVTRNITTLHQTKLVQKLLVFVLKQVAKRWGIDLLGKGPNPEMTEEEIRAEMAKEEPFRDFDEPAASDGRAKGGASIASEADVEVQRPEIEVELEEDLIADPEIEDLMQNEAPKIKLLDPQFKTIQDESAKGGIAIAVAVVKLLAPVVVRSLKRRANGSEHGLYPTVMEELLREVSVADFGVWLWSGMKDVAREMWEPNTGTITEKSHAGAYFLQKLAAYQKDNPELTIDLIGHSAGSIVICHLLAAAAKEYPDLKIRNIIFLAPACTMKLFHEELVSKPNRCEAFTMFTMKNDFEAKDVLVPAVYTRSLLYFVSGALEGNEPVPLAGLQRWMQAGVSAPHGVLPSKTLGDIHAFLSQTKPIRLVLSKTEDGASEGMRCKSITHGGFDNDLNTRDSLSFIIKK